MAFNTKLYSAFTTGNDANDGLTPATAFKTFAPAKALIEAGAIGQYEHVFLEDTSENCTLNLTGFPTLLLYSVCKVTFANGIKALGTGNFLTIQLSGSHYGGVECNAWDVQGYTYIISILGAYSSYSFFTNSNLNASNVVSFPSIEDLHLINSVFIGSELRNPNVTTTSQFRHIENCTLDNVITFTNNFAIYPITNGVGEHGIIRNVFKNMNIAIRVKNGEPSYKFLQGNNFENCSFFLYTATNLSPIVYTACNSVADLDALYLARFGTSANGEFNNNTFNAISVDQFNYPTDETVNYLQRHQGARRYSSEAPAVSPPTGWAIISDTYYTTSDTPDPLVLVVSIPQARKARRVVIEFDRANDIEQFGTDGRIAVKIKESHDGGLTFPFAEFTRYVGIQASTLDFDYIDSSATDWQLTIESQDIAGGAGGVLFRWIGIEFYDMEDQITAGTRTLYEQKATDPNGYFVVGLPYEVVTGSGDFTAQEIKDNVSAIKVYAGVEETNISSFELDGEIYNTFVPDVVQIASVRAIRAGLNGSKLELKDVPCSNYDSKMLKFKNGAGVWEYLLFYAKDEEKSNRSSEQYLQFEDGYKNVNGDIQRDYRIFNDQFDILNKPVLDYLDKNQNVWYANGWHFSSFKMILMPSTISNFPLLINERFVKADLTQTQYNELFKRFKTGDRITFATDSSIVDMYGFVAQMSEVSGVYTVYFKFTGATGNDDLATLDAYLGVTDLYIVAYDAWELCAIDNATVTATSRSVLNVSLTLKTNPETNYRV